MSSELDPIQIVSSLCFFWTWTNWKAEMMLCWGEGGGVTLYDTIQVIRDNKTLANNKLASFTSVSEPTARDCNPFIRISFLSHALRFIQLDMRKYMATLGCPKEQRPWFPVN